MSSPELVDRLRRAVATNATAFEPAAGLARRITRRTRERERRRRAVLASLTALGTAIGVVVIVAAGSDDQTLPVAARVRTPAAVARATTGGPRRHAAPTPAARSAAASTPAVPPGLWSYLAGVASRTPQRSTTPTVLDAQTARAAARSAPSGSAPSGSKPTTPTTRSTTPPTTRPPPTTTTTTTTTTSPPPPAPTVAIDGPTLVCVDAPATYTARATDADSLAWDNGQSGASAQYTFTAAGQFTVTVTATGAGGVVSVASGVDVVPAGTGPC